MKFKQNQFKYLRLIRSFGSPDDTKSSQSIPLGKNMMDGLRLSSLYKDVEDMNFNIYSSYRGYLKMYIRIFNTKIDNNPL